MASIVSAHHVGLTVASLDRSINFYGGILGFEVVFRWNPKADYIGQLVGYPNVDLHAAILRMPGTEVFLELLEYRNVESGAIDPANGNAGTVHIAFRVDDVDALHEMLLARGVSAVSAPITPTIGPNEGGRAVYMIDPDGVRVELIQSPRRFDEYTPPDDEPPQSAGCC